MRGLVLRGSHDKIQDVNEFYNEKLEQKLSRIDKMPNYLKRGVPFGNNVIAVVTHLGEISHGTEKKEKFFGVAELSLEGQEHVNWLNKYELIAEAYKQVHYGANLVGDAGDIYYAQRGVGETATNDFDFMELGSGIQTPTVTKTDDRGDLLNNIAGADKNIASGYPQSNDTDTDNTGRNPDVSTWLGSYTTSDFNHTDVRGVIITNTGPGATEPILTRAILASFAKSSTDTLKLFVNHTANGV